MMMKPIKCKKLAVSRVSSPPRCSKPPGVPFTDEIHFHLHRDARRAAPLLMATARDSASSSGGMPSNRATDVTTSRHTKAGVCQVLNSKCLPFSSQEGKIIFLLIVRRGMACFSESQLSKLSSARFRWQIALHGKTAHTEHPSPRRKK